MKRNAFLQVCLIREPESPHSSRLYLSKWIKQDVFLKRVVHVHNGLMTGPIRGSVFKKDMLTVCRFAPKSAVWAVCLTKAIRKSDSVEDLHMEEGD